MQVTFLGTGTSGGVPVLTCGCEICNSLDYRDKRLRVSVWIEVENKSFVIDTGPDFRQQALRERIPNIDAIIYTHKDHTAGLDDIRPYNYLHGIHHLDLYGHPRVLSQLKQEFAYAFDEQKYPGVPLLNLHEITGGVLSNQPFTIKGVLFTPIEVLHHKLPVLGFRVKDFTYITDVNFISEQELEKIYGTKVLVLGALQRNKHISHFTLDEAIEVAQKVNAEMTYLTHISHKMGLHSEVEKELPPNIRLAYDGLKIRL
jgi:phosphoribosyl 1,2-cyclic phosphate phosphodiesterase